MNVKTLENFRYSFTKIYEYNIRYSIKYANRIRKLMLNSIKRLNNFPYIGRYLPEDNDKEYRELICQKYRILYSVSENDDIVYIHYIIYAGENFRALFKIYNNKKIDN